MDEPRQDSVRIVDIDMPFGSMVRFMVKWAIASIPALIILMVIAAAVAAMLAGVTSGFGRRSRERAFTSSSSDISTVLDSLRGASSPAASNPEWQVSRSKNPIDDSPTVTLMLEASSPVAHALSDAPTLLIRCKSKDTELFINWDSYLGSDETSVTTRLGHAPAATRSWSLSTDSKASFFPGSPVGFIKQLMTVDNFVAVTTPYNESPVTAIFVVKGLRDSVAPLRTACGW